MSDVVERSKPHGQLAVETERSGRISLVDTVTGQRYAVPDVRHLIADLECARQAARATVALAERRRAREEWETRRLQSDSW